MKEFITPTEARRERRDAIAAAMQHDRPLTVHEMRHLHQELAEAVAADPKHDSALHLGDMSPDMRECPQCHALMAGLHVIRDFLAQAD